MTAKVPPGPAGSFLFGSLYDFRTNPLQLLLDMCREYGDVCRFRIGLQNLYLFNHPDYISHILVDRDKKYKKSRLDIQALAPIIGQGLLLSEGDLWKRHRRLLQPLFSQQQFEAYGQIVTDYTAEMLERWSSQAQSGEAFDLAGQVTDLTMRVIAKTILGLDFAGTDKELTEAIEFATDHANSSMETIVPIPDWVPTPSHLRFERAKGVLNKMVNDLIDQRRRGNLESKDLLTLMMRTRDEETGEGLSDAMLRDQVMTFFLAGHETTAQTLKWLFVMLSRHPHVDQQVHSEVQRVLGGRAPTFAEAGKLEYTRMVIQEVMRLWPPAWLMAREAVLDDEVGGYHVPAGTQVVFSQWVMHRHPAYWENPEGFDPERFSPERSAGRSHGIYFPFGAGPRVCIGSTFAMMELLMIVPMIVQKYRLDLMPSPAVAPKPTITLRPLHGVPVRARPRQS